MNTTYFYLNLMQVFTADQTSCKTKRFTVGM